VDTENLMPVPYDNLAVDDYGPWSHLPRSCAFPPSAARDACTQASGRSLSPLRTLSPISTALLPDLPPMSSLSTRLSLSPSYSLRLRLGASPTARMQPPCF
jgi:hypothetical protein